MLGTERHDMIEKERNWGDVDNVNFKLQDNFKEEKLNVLLKLGVHRNQYSEKHYDIDYSAKMWQFNSKCTIMSLPSTSLVLTQNKNYDLVIHQHHFLLHNSFPQEFPIYSCFSLRSSNGMAEDPHMKFHTGRIERERIVLLRTCNAHSIYLCILWEWQQKSQVNL